MSIQITLALSDEVYQRAERFARLTNRDLETVLADTIDLSIPPLSPQVDTLDSIADLADNEVLSLTELQIEPTQDRRLSELLDRQQAGSLAEAERPELQALMQVYQEGLLRKATALSEAVRRGLIAPLDS